MFCSLREKNSAEKETDSSDEEFENVQNAFATMIDETCRNGAGSGRSIFSSAFPSSTKNLDTFLRSIAPNASALQKDFPTETSENRFEYGDDHDAKYTFQVLDRRTNRLNAEQMPRHHRYAMKLLFSGLVQRELLHTKTVQNLFARETIRLGRAFDEPKSRKHIAAFVKMYRIDLDELLEPNINRYFTFNEFFYRKLKTNARPIDQPEDSSRIVSAADCRLIVFDNVRQATQIWIKGLQFSLENLFDDRNLAKEFENGSIGIFRLAPVDYHRFHSPVQGTIGQEIKLIGGTFYTVNPVAIKENLDVLTRNQRTVLTIENQNFEKIVFVAIGALLVGSVNLTIKPSQQVEKGDELGRFSREMSRKFESIHFSGFFAYGGSTVVVVFKEGMVKWDEDLQHNSNNSMETLVQMGEHIGRLMTEDERQNYFQTKQNEQQVNSTISQLIHHFPHRRQIK